MLCDATVDTFRCPLCRRTDHPKTSRAKCSTNPSHVHLQSLQFDSVAEVLGEATSKEEDAAVADAARNSLIEESSDAALSVCVANQPAQRSTTPTANILSATTRLPTNIIALKENAPDEELVNPRRTQARALACAQSICLSNSTVTYQVDELKLVFNTTRMLHDLLFEKYYSGDRNCNFVVERLAFCCCC